MITKDKNVPVTQNQYTIHRVLKMGNNNNSCQAGMLELHRHLLTFVTPTRQEGKYSYCHLMDEKN